MSRTDCRREMGIVPSLADKVARAEYKKPLRHLTADLNAAGCLKMKTLRWPAVYLEAIPVLSA